ncbi:MAG TPA: hypothetical protein VHU85_17935 [Acidimicrobiales bacterium]|jgi:hypothetical protein|nr:hypothetical protein [Acidimicrobiales bacterium]
MDVQDFMGRSGSQCATLRRNRDPEVPEVDVPDVVPRSGDAFALG